MKAKKEPIACTYCGERAEYRGLVERSEFNHFQHFCVACADAAIRWEYPPYELVELDQAAVRRRSQQRTMRLRREKELADAQQAFFGPEVGRLR